MPPGESTASVRHAEAFGNRVDETLAILVGGGPAPGINGVIASAAMEALQCAACATVGIYDGYRDLASRPRRPRP